MRDERFESIYTRLRLLNNVQLQKILDADNLCYDSYNYDESTGKYCPLAEAFSIPEKLKFMGVSPTQNIVQDLLIQEAGPAWGTVKNINGTFYTTNRETDLKGLCRKILNERNSMGIQK